MTDEEKRAAEEKALKERREKVLADAKELGLVALSQDRLDGLIDEGYKRGAKNSGEAKKLTDLEAEIKALREAAAAKPYGKAKDKGADGDDLEARISQLNEQWEQKLKALDERAVKAEQGRTEEAQKHRRERLRSKVLSAAASKDINAHSPDQIFTLMEAQNAFKWDEESGDWILVNEKGQIRIDATNGGKNMTVEAGVKEYAERNPHMRRASGRAGSGQADGQATNDRETTPAPKGLEGETLLPSQVFTNRHAVLRHLEAGGTLGKVGQHNVNPQR